MTAGKCEPRRFVGVDQYEHTYWLGPHPRKELLERLDRTRAALMYRDDASPRGYRHVGYVIAGLWIEVFELTPLQKQAGKGAA